MNARADSRAAASGVALFALGFRPFFLLAMASAALLMVPWALAYRGALSFDTYYGVLPWHAHEMIFGYTAAVIAGFLLTSVWRWTDIETPKGWPLAALVLLWLAGRGAPFLHHALPVWNIAALDLAFLPVLTLSLAIPLLRNAPPRNLIFVPVLAVLVIANALVYAERPGSGLATARIGFYLGVDVIVLLIALIGGRVLPFFTDRALPDAAPVRRIWLEPIAIGSVIALAVVRPLSPPPALLGGIAAVAALAHALRLAGWHARRVWSVPLLWVLYLGYGWMVIGFGLTALASIGRASPFLALHAFTSGAIGVMTLGMMARVALGHTGRPLRPAAPTVVTFALVNLAAVVRVLAPLIIPARAADLVALSGLLWVTTFGLVFGAHAGILVRPRADGRPG